MIEKLESTEVKSQTDWDKVDAHIITQEEYDEIPEITDEMMDSAVFKVGGKEMQSP